MHIYSNDEAASDKELLRSCSLLTLMAPMLYYTLNQVSISSLGPRAKWPCVLAAASHHQALNVSA